MELRNESSRTSHSNGCGYVFASGAPNRLDITENGQHLRGTDCEWNPVTSFFN
jgi:hypothetical protein